MTIHTEPPRLLGDGFTTIDPATIKDGDTHTLLVDQIICDTKLQIRNKIDLKTVKRYADAMRAHAETKTPHGFPPILAKIVHGNPFVVDGWHRLAAAKEAGVREIEVTFTTAENHELRWLGAAANMRHGLQLKVSERLGVFKAYVKANQHLTNKGRVKSSRVIANDLQNMWSHTNVLKQMKRHFPRIAARMTGEVTEWDDAREPKNLEGPSALDAVEAHLRDARNAARALGTPEDRGAALRSLMEIWAEIEAQGPVSDPGPIEF